jgi:hypothetical protein
LFSPLNALFQAQNPFQNSSQKLRLPIAIGIHSNYLVRNSFHKNTA